MKKLITSIISKIKKMMENYDEIYREAYMDPGFLMMEGYMQCCCGYYM